MANSRQSDDTFVSCARIKVRKPHKCQSCGGVIKKGVKCWIYRGARQVLVFVLTGRGENNG
jgi:hypothetical protein